MPELEINYLLFYCLLFKIYFSFYRKKSTYAGKNMVLS